MYSKNPNTDVCRHLVLGIVFFITVYLVGESLCLHTYMYFIFNESIM